MNPAYFCTKAVLARRSAYSSSKWARDNVLLLSKFVCIIADVGLRLYFCGVLSVFGSVINVKHPRVTDF